MSEVHDDSGGAKCAASGEHATSLEEAHTMIRLWNEFSYGLFHDNVTRGVHPAPAMWQLLASMINGNNPLDPLLDALEPSEAAEERVAASLQYVAAFGDALFQFGQFCAMRGFLYANLVQCKCASITDDDLQNLLGQPHPKGPGADA